MATHAAIAAVTRTLRSLLLDRMVVAPAAAVTTMPPDVELQVNDSLVNIYLFQIIENAELKNQEIPGRGYSAAYGRPPLSLNLRYLLTTRSANETQADADLNAQTLLGDAMRVLHDFGNRIAALSITRPAAGTVGDPILDPVLADEFEHIKIVLHPASLDDMTKLWSALSEANFRRAVIYEVTVVQIETPEPRFRPEPVQTRNIFMTVRRRPSIAGAYVTPPINGPIGEMRVRIGDEITIVTENALAERLYVRLGALEPIRISPPGDGYIRIHVPDNQYPADLDHPAPRPIPLARQLQPGLLEVQVIAERSAEGVAGGLDHGSAAVGTRRQSSNLVLMQLVPSITSVNPASGNATLVLQVVGTRLWHPGARVAEVLIADAAVNIRPPGPGDPWAAPTPTTVEIPVSEAAAHLPVLGLIDPPYPVAVQIDGARSRDPRTFKLVL